MPQTRSYLNALALAEAERIVVCAHARLSRFALAATSSGSVRVLRGLGGGVLGVVIAVDVPIVVHTIGVLVVFIKKMICRRVLAIFCDFYKNRIFF